LWDPVTDQLPGSLEGHGGRVVRLAFCVGCGLLVSGNQDGKVKLCAVSRDPERASLAGHGDADGTVKLWDVSVAP
jgi:WD40 repeat protein